MDARVPRSAGVGIGVLVGIIAVRSGGLGTGLLLAAPLFGLCTLTGVLAGELSARPRHGTVRTAPVEVRRIRNYLPRRLGPAVAVTGGLLTVLAVATTLAASPDDLGRPGRVLARQCTADVGEARGPWPGLYYTGPLAIVVITGLLLAYLALRAIVRRPRSGDPTDDDALRRRVARVVTGAVGILVVIPLAGISLTVVEVVRSMSCLPAWWMNLGQSLLLLVPASLAMACWCIAAILTPVNRSKSTALPR
jgi:hypothetical protein